MSTGVADAVPRSVHRTAGLPVWIVLGRTELRRILLHPVLLGSLAFVVLAGGLDRGTGPREAYAMVTSAGVFFLGPFAFFAANLLASRDRRHGSEDWLSSLPAPRRDRTAALLVACAGPAVLVTLLALITYAVYAAAGQMADHPVVLEVLAVCLGVLGGALLGVMVARWAPFPGAALLVMVALVAFHVSLRDDQVLLGAYVEFARWGETPEAWAGVIDGSRAWHAVYLAGLCAMAAIGALLVDVRRRTTVFALGVAVAAATALAGWAQLP